MKENHFDTLQTVKFLEHLIECLKQEHDKQNNLKIPDRDVNIERVLFYHFSHYYQEYFQYEQLSLLRRVLLLLFMYRSMLNSEFDNEVMKFPPKEDMPF